MHTILFVESQDGGRGAAGIPALIWVDRIILAFYFVCLFGGFGTHNE